MFGLTRCSGRFGGVTTLSGKPGAVHRVTFELIGELASRSSLSQQNSFPTRCVHSRTSNALFVEVSGHRGELQPYRETPGTVQGAGWGGSGC